MKKSFIYSLFLLIFLVSCKTTNDIGYVQNFAKYATQPHPDLGSVRINAMDELQVTMFSGNPEATTSFNLLEGRTIDGTLRVISGFTPVRYIVTPEGNIDLPLIGRLNVIGKTKEEVEDIVTEKLKAFYKEGEYVVTVRINEWTFTVLGEVSKPGMLYTDHESVNIFEALAAAGDMTIHGVRDEVKVIREHKDGTKAIATLDLTDAAIVDSPYFYLQQDDVVYAQPNKAKVHNADVASSSRLWLRGASISISLLALLFSILR